MSTSCGSMPSAAESELPADVYLNRFNVDFYLEDALGRLEDFVSTMRQQQNQGATASSSSSSAGTGANASGSGTGSSAAGGGSATNDGEGNANASSGDAPAGGQTPSGTNAASSASGDQSANAAAGSTNVDPRQSLQEQLRFLGNYFFGVLDGQHVTCESRSFAYVSATPWNRRAFVTRAQTQLFVRLRAAPAVASLGVVDEPEEPTEDHAQCDVGDEGEHQVTAGEATEEGNGNATTAGSSSSSSVAEKENESVPSPELKKDFSCTLADFHALLQTICLDYPLTGAWRDVLELLLEPLSASRISTVPALAQEKFNTDIPPKEVPSKGAAQEAWKQAGGPEDNPPQGAGVAGDNIPVRRYSMAQLENAWAFYFVYSDFVDELRVAYRTTHVLRRAKLLGMIQSCRARSGEAWLDYIQIEKVFEKWVGDIKPAGSERASRWARNALDREDEAAYSFKELFARLAADIGPHSGMDDSFRGLEERNAANALRQRLSWTAQHEDEERRRRSREKKMSNSRKRRNRRN
ncbi:unnamed protein product [Amoebophrya sp. A25]|nr:unnamed protein product [Amoebophrya sp. A25]|eukprot:GSA25T00001742001.1